MRSAQEEKWRRSLAELPQVCLTDAGKVLLLSTGDWLVTEVRLQLAGVSLL